MSWLYVPEVEGWSLESDSWSEKAAASLTWRGKRSRPQAWSARWRRLSWLRLLSGLTFSPSMVQRGAERWIASLPASRASRGAQRENEREPATIGGSGPRSPESFGMWDRASSSWKTFPDSSEGGGSSLSSETWPKWGSMRNGVVSKRPMWAPVTGGNGSSSWQTPRGSERGSYQYDNHDKSKPRATLTGQAKMWTTPVVADSKGTSGGARPTKHGGKSLRHDVRMWPTPDTSQRGGFNTRPGPAGARPTISTMAKMWPTPKACEGEKPSAGNRNQNDLSRTSRLWGTPMARDWKNGGLKGSLSDQMQRLKNGHSARLNPPFVEWLMGWPIGWTDFEYSGTGLSRTKRRWHSWSSALVWELFDK